MKFKIQNSLFFFKFLRINKYVTKLSRFKILFDRANFRRIIKIQNPLLATSIKFSRNRIIKIQSPSLSSKPLSISSLFFDQIFTKLSKFKILLPLRSQISTKTRSTDPTDSSLERLRSINFHKILPSFSLSLPLSPFKISSRSWKNSQHEKKWEENRENKVQGVPP